MPAHLSAGTDPGKVILKESKALGAEEAKVMVQRLDEIMAMDIKNMNVAEKKVMRKEVRAIKSDLREGSQGIYLSFGIIIIIILLLVLLL